MSASAADLRPTAILVRALTLALILGAAPAALAQPTPLGPSPLGPAPVQEQPAAEAPQPQGGAPQPGPSQSGAPLRLVPFGQAQQPAAPQPTAPSGLEVEALGTLSVDGGGTLMPGSGGLPQDAWAGTPRPLAEGLIATLPERISSAAMRAALSRLLLSDIAPPAGEAGERGFAARRLERLALLGDWAGAEGFAAKVPAALEDEATARAWTTGRLLAGNAEAACAEVGENVRRFQDPVWLKFQIACQVRAGELAAATLGVDLLREQGDGDEDFLLLAESAAAGRTAPVKGVFQPTAPQLALILASKRSPEPETRVSSPAALAALARSPDVPIALRLTAAEQAASLGLLTPAELTAVYQSVSIPDNELRDPLIAIADRQGAQARALAVQALRNAASPGIKAELLRAAVAAGDLPLLSGTYGAILTQEIGQLAPSGTYAFLAPFAARTLLLQGRADLARAWVDIARAELLGGNADPALFYRLWPLAALNGLARPTDVAFAEWAEGLGATPDNTDAMARVTGVVAVMWAAGVPMDRAALDALLIQGRTIPTGGAATPPDPLLAARLAEAAGEGREAEALLLAAHMIGSAGPAATAALDASLAVDGLRRAGLESEARRLATEAAAALIDP